MGRILESIAQYSRMRRLAATTAPAANEAACKPVSDAPVEQRRRETPARVKRRPDPQAWGEDELLALHEAVALIWPAGPVTVSSLRTAIAKGELAYARIAGRIYTTRAALAAMASCERREACDGDAPAEGVDWDAHLKSLLQ
jgi:hypothetical protein